LGSGAGRLVDIIRDRFRPAGPADLAPRSAKLEESDGILMEKTILYFDQPGEANTDETLAIARLRSSMVLDG